MKLQIDSINLDFQPEENLDLETVATLVQALENGETFPPVTVYSDGKNYWLFDGFHRVKAAREAKLTEIEADVVPGTYSDMEKRYQEFLEAVRQELRKPLLKP